jgi:tetratricopeptide (TPR) repeat protein
MSALIHGQRLSSRFMLLQPLGRGGMGEVWLARDGELNEHVALKILAPALSASPEMVALLRHECRNTRRLIHPNIVRVYDFHNIDGRYFLSMEYIDGADLGQYRGYPWPRILSAIIPVTRALEYAHSRGVVHRDLKPSNILRARDGTVHVADFGIAAVLHTDPSAPTVSTGGSFYCMSPQQLSGEPSRPSDDLYALGVLLYELLSGKPPFYPHITESRIRAETPAPIAALEGADTPGSERLAGVVGALLEKSPTARPPDMAAVRTQLEAILRIEAERTVPPDAGRTSLTGAWPDDRITPIGLRAATSRRADSTAGRRQRLLRLATLFAFLLLIAAGIAVFHFLPQQVAERQRHAIPAAPGQPPPSATTTVNTSSGTFGPTTAPRPASGTPSAEGSPAGAEPGREAAEQALGEMLRAGDELQGMGVEAWGADRYAAARSRAAAGDDHLKRRDYAAAVGAYGDAARMMVALRDAKGDILRDALRAGTLALETGDAPEATAQFTVALGIDPGNPAAQRGLARAGTLVEVLRLLNSGAAHERSHDLERARADYRQALDMDPDSTPARESLERVAGLIDEAAFNAAMSQGLAALNSGDYATARTAFGEAGRLAPGAQAPRDGISRAEQGLRLAAIGEHRRQAQTLEAQERWAEAERHYAEAIAIDPALEFAPTGKARAHARAVLDQHLQALLDQPARLSSQRVYEEADELLRQARAIAPRGARLRGQITALEKLVKAAGTPVKVRLRSDNLTEVVVYRVGRLGRFTSRELDLRPGTYTAVGSRRGYRDVRMEFAVVPGAAQPPVFIVCEDKV